MRRVCLRQPAPLMAVIARKEGAATSVARRERGGRWTVTVPSARRMTTNAQRASASAVPEAINGCGSGISTPRRARAAGDLRERNFVSEPARR
jgi:hypothetical protein